MIELNAGTQVPDHVNNVQKTSTPLRRTKGTLLLDDAKHYLAAELFQGFGWSATLGPNKVSTTAWPRKRTPKSYRVAAETGRAAFFALSAAEASLSTGFYQAKRNRPKNYLVAPHGSANGHVFSLRAIDPLFA